MCVENSQHFTSNEIPDILKCCKENNLFQNHNDFDGSNSFTMPTDSELAIKHLENLNSCDLHSSEVVKINEMSITLSSYEQLEFEIEPNIIKKIKVILIKQGSNEPRELDLLLEKNLKRIRERSSKESFLKELDQSDNKELAILIHIDTIEARYLLNIKYLTNFPEIRHRNEKNSLLILYREDNKFLDFLNDAVGTLIYFKCYSEKIISHQLLDNNNVDI